MMTKASHSSCLSSHCKPAAVPPVVLISANNIAFFTEQRWLSLPLIPSASYTHVQSSRKVCWLCLRNAYRIYTLVSFSVHGGIDCQVHYHSTKLVCLPSMQRPFIIQLPKGYFRHLNHIALCFKASCGFPWQRQDSAM